jgi:hypothetical protein
MLLARVSKIVSDFVRQFAGLRLGWVVALGGLAAALPRYVSHENRQVLGRYSHAYVAVMAAVLVALLVAASLSLRRARRDAAPVVRSEIVWAQLALALWGVAYLVAALGDEREVVRILALNVLGSSYPLAAALEWCAMVAATIAVTLFLSERLPAWSHNAALMVASIAVLLLLGEGITRAKAIIAPTILGVPTHGATIFTRRYVSFNADGFRDANHATAALPRTRRLLLVGDSFAFGAGIRDLDDRFGERLTQILSARTGETWESICACKVDRHTLEETEFLRRTIRYEPDAVVLLYVFNDIDYLASTMTFRPVTDRTSVLFEHPSTVAARVHPLRLLYWNSYLAQEVIVRLRQLHFGRAGTNIDDPYADRLVLQRHLRDIAEFVRLGRDGGAVVGVVPYEPLAVADSFARRRHDRFVLAARAAGIPIWPVTEALAGRPLRQLTVNAIDRHPSAQANRLAAEAAASQLLATLAGPASRTGAPAALTDRLQAR